MRVLFTASNSGGHYFCMIPLGWALQAAGHEVRVACPPGQAAAISNAGLIPVPVLDGIDLEYWARLTRYQEAVDGTLNLPGMPMHPDTGERVSDLGEFDVAAASERFMGQIFGALNTSYDAAVELTRAWRPDLVLYDLLTVEGALAAQLTGVPSIYHSLGLFGAAETEPGLDMGMDDPTESFARFGQPAWNREEVPYVIDPSPSSALPPHGAALSMPVRFIPYNGPGGVPPWLLEPAPRGRVCVLWGYSATTLYGPDVPALRTAIDAAAAHGSEVVLTAPQKVVDVLGDLPDGVRVLSGFPLHLLLQTCDALIHHGGAGAVMTAAASGVPQVALSMSEDQIAFGRRITPTGAVLSLPGLTTPPDQVEQGVKTVLTDTFREAARVLKEDIAAKPTPAQLVPALERLARDGRLTADRL